MSLNEIAEVLTVDMESDPLVDFERRLEDPQDLLELCSGLLSINSKDWEGKETLQFSHFSVREFLESPRLDNGPARKFAVDEMRANTLIAESCIAYNMNLESLQVNMPRSIIREKYPLSQYALRKWHKHAQKARENGRIIPLIERFFRSQNSELPFWIRSSCMTLDIVHPQDIFAPLHCAVQISLPKIMRKLILEGAHVNSKSRTGVTPLMVVAEAGYERVEEVHFLLNHGAEVNACDDEGCTALMHASRMGFIQIVRILLDNGADPEARSKDGETALILASRGAHTEIVHLLLGSGASTDSPIGVIAMFVTSRREIVQILLDRGVDINARFDSFRGNNIRVIDAALLNACKHQHFGTADLLVENGADVNARFTLEDRDAVILEHLLANDKPLPYSDAAFEEARKARIKHRDRIFRFLIEHGADPNLVDIGNLDHEAKKRYDALLNERDSKRLGRVD